MGSSPQSPVVVGGLTEITSGSVPAKINKPTFPFKNPNFIVSIYLHLSCVFLHEFVSHFSLYLHIVVIDL